jgi:outer membrane receptor for ferric coprogen and ferric-rhodotorulic acid
MDNWKMGLGIANFEAEDANGNKVTTTSSRTMANLFTKYTLEKFGFGVGLNYRSKIYTGSGATQIVQDAYVLTNAMISYAMDKHTKLQFNVNNIFDKKYYEGIGANGMVYGAPLNAMFSAKYSF